MTEEKIEEEIKESKEEIIEVIEQEEKEDIIWQEVALKNQSLLTSLVETTQQNQKTITELMGVLLKPSSKTEEQPKPEMEEQPKPETELSENRNEGEENPEPKIKKKPIQMV